MPTSTHYRVSEHMGTSAYTEEVVSHSALSSILVHERKTGHDISLDNISIEEQVKPVKASYVGEACRLLHTQ